MAVLSLVRPAATTCCGWLVASCMFALQLHLLWVAGGIILQLHLLRVAGGIMHVCHAATPDVGSWWHHACLPCQVLTADTAHLITGFPGRTNKCA